jgi:hypothetical protein
MSDLHLAGINCSGYPPHKQDSPSFSTQYTITSNHPHQSSVHNTISSCASPYLVSSRVRFIMSPDNSFCPKSVHHMLPSLKLSKHMHPLMREHYPNLPVFICALWCEMDANILRLGNAPQPTRLPYAVQAPKFGHISSPIKVKQLPTFKSTGLVCFALCSPMHYCLPDMQKNNREV